MGTWNAGNFDNDSALDYVGDLIDQLTNTINSCFEDDNADLDEGGEGELMPSVFIIDLLSQHCGAAPPKPDVIESWCDRYVKIYDEQIDGLEPDPEFKVNRRKVVADTFSSLIATSNEFWNP
jgi:hypothetical protein